MESIWPENIAEVLKEGVPMFDLGINNWALTKDRALAALEKLKVIKVAVLGGDVYESANGRLVPNYDNWYCDQYANEAREDFATRSIEKSIKFIEHYRASANHDIYFVLVLDF